MAPVVSTQEEALVEEKKTQIISPPYEEEAIVRKSHFLKPILPSTETTIPYPHPPPTLSLSSATLDILSQKVKFNCWRGLSQNWETWVAKLKPRFESTWKKAGIFESIIGSTYDIPVNRNLIFKIIEKWCPESNTFLFSAGEATITLEDVMVLGGYSVVGDSILSENHGNEFQEIEAHLVKVRADIIKGKARKACMHSWLNYWLENEGKYEHEAFLSMWLSRSVFPTDSVDTINESLFSMAIRLAHGTQMALAPAILACLYRDLRLLKHKMMQYSNIDLKDAVHVAQLKLRAPLQLIQVWVYERFSALRPNITWTDQHGKPRLARWHKSKIMKIEVDADINFSLDNGEESFLWRPYDSSSCGDFSTYARIIRVSELLAFDCSELYLPQRVGRQFGFDQDIPDQVPISKSSPDIAWRNYVKPINELKLYVPSRHYNAGVTSRYLKWWKELKEDAKRKGSSTKDRGKRKRAATAADYEDIPIKGWEDVPRVKREMNEAEVTPGFSPNNKVFVIEDSSDDDDLDHLTIGSWFARSKSSKSADSSAGDIVVSGRPKQTSVKSERILSQDSDTISWIQKFVEDRNRKSNVGSVDRCGKDFIINDDESLEVKQAEEVTQSIVGSLACFKDDIINDKKCGSSSRGGVLGMEATFARMGRLMDMLDSGEIKLTKPN